MRAKCAGINTQLTLPIAPPGPETNPDDDARLRTMIAALKTIRAEGAPGGG